MEDKLTTALRLHEFMTAHHWTGQRLVGPDVGVRFNIRFTRFVKSYLPKLRWKDDYYYLQSQGYWVLGNWRLHGLTGDERYREIALQCSEAMLAAQRADGAWDYPHPEWKGRVATAEGSWASIGLIDSYRATQEARFLEGALRWHSFLMTQTGFQRHNDELAVNYFSSNRRPRITNNSSFVTRFLGELAEATGDEKFVEPCPGMLRFLWRVQTPAGELPYGVAEDSHHAVKAHYQCYQYNAFQALDLLRYSALRGDRTAQQIAGRVIEFLTTGVEEDGRISFDCKTPNPHVAYHSAAVGAALAAGSAAGVANCDALAERCFASLRNSQWKDGGFGFSEQDYGILSDRRAYPRAMSMILFHLVSTSATTDAKAAIAV